MKRSHQSIRRILLFWRSARVQSGSVRNETEGLAKARGSAGRIRGTGIVGTRGGTGQSRHNSGGDHNLTNLIGPIGDKEVGAVGRNLRGLVKTGRVAGSIRIAPNPTIPGPGRPGS